MIGQKAENIPADCDLVVYTVAIPADNPEMVEAKKRGIKMLTYPETLNIISKEKYTIAVSGTHGKTTVTAMVAKVMIDAGLDPTVIVGSLISNPAPVESSSPLNGVPNRSEDVSSGGVKNFESNFVMGQSKYLVVEADEYKKSFHNLEPSILVINNIDLDHLDFYKDLVDIQSSFLHLAQKLPADGFLICNTKLPNLKPIIEGVRCKVIDYSEIEMKEKLLIPGEHNRQNAKTALGVAQALGISPSTVLEALKKFSGTWRRFEYKGKTKSGALVYDDYAHNPQKVKAALQGAREMYPRQLEGGQAGKRIVVVFQPHLFSRTKLLLNDFATAFGDADEVILTPIFPAREVFDPTISSEMLAGCISAYLRRSTESARGGGVVRAFPNFSAIESYLKSTLGPNDVLITMGAGEQYKIGENLL